MALMIITQQTIREATASLIIYRKANAYQVAFLHPGQRIELLKDAQFWTYDAAHERMQQEVRGRTTDWQQEATN